MIPAFAAAAFLLSGALAATNRGETRSDRRWWRVEVVAAGVAVVVWTWAVLA